MCGASRWNEGHVNGKLELWRQTLELFRLSRTKIEYIRCDFSGMGGVKTDISLYKQMVTKKDTF